MPEAPSQRLRSRPSRPRAGTTCPTCGAPAERGQLVCLECGGRIALDYRRTPSWKLPLLVVGAVLIVAAVAFFLLLRAVTSRSESEAAKTPARGQTRAAAGSSTRRAPRRRARRRPAARRRPPQAARTGGVQGWPRKNAFTVVLSSTGDRAGATKVAKSMISRGVPAGVLRADDYSSLTAGYWIVFSGRYPTRPRAERAAARLDRRVSGAYVQFVNGAGKGG